MNKSPIGSSAWRNCNKQRLIVATSAPFATGNVTNLEQSLHETSANKYWKIRNLSNNKDIRQQKFNFTWTSSLLSSAIVASRKAQCCVRSRAAGIRSIFVRRERSYLDPGGDPSAFYENLSAGVIIIWSRRIGPIRRWWRWFAWRQTTLRQGTSPATWRSFSPSLMGPLLSPERSTVSRREPTASTCTRRETWPTAAYPPGRISTLRTWVHRDAIASRSSRRVDAWNKSLENASSWVLRLIATSEMRYPFGG